MSTTATPTAAPTIEFKRQIAVDDCGVCGEECESRELVEAFVAGSDVPVHDECLEGDVRVRLDEARGLVNAEYAQWDRERTKERRAFVIERALLEATTRLEAERVGAAEIQDALTVALSRRGFVPRSDDGVPF
jgi:hypothetical protein